MDMPESISIEQIGWKANSKTGIVAAGGAEAVAAGISMLQQEGNAADAAAAALLTLMVCDHGYCSIGGEVPVMIYDVNKKVVKVLSGQGSAPLSEAAINWYMQNGIPEEGNIKVAPVPSVVDCCLTLLKMYGTKSFSEIIAPALALLDSGTADWHPRLAVTLRKMASTEQSTSGSRAEKIQSACDRFYGRGNTPGDIAEALEEFYLERGGFLRKGDLAAHTTRIEDPIMVNYRGYTVCKCGPWTQGPYLCQALRLLEGFDLKSMGHLSSSYIHTVIEAIKLAMADRDEYYGDPNFVEVPLTILLSDEYTRIRQPLIDMHAASQDVRPGDPYNMKSIKAGGVFRPGIGGTTTCIVADRWGNVVVATPSANVFPKRHDGGRAGVTFGNRLRSFNTTPGHPNCIAPGKRPRITLTPTLVLKDGKPILAISVAGGDLQDQVALNLLLGFIEFDLLPEQAVIDPRFVTSHHQDSFDPNPNRQQTFGRPGSLVLNDTVDPSVREELSLRGHHLEVLGLGSPPIGSPIMLYIDHEKGIFHAAGDPAALRHAAGLEDQ
jgi:gamma-glutamyltranspeptidase / glutathione hydrolase